MTVGKWLKGDPIDSYSPNQTYLVVFWSTWCAAFIPTMQHLDELNGQFSHQVQTVAVSVFESSRARLFDYVNKMAYKMDFTVAEDKITSDDKRGLDGVMAKNWLEASGQYGLPIAFIVDKAGKIAWIGSPVGATIDEPLRKIVDGSWDTAAFAEKFNSDQEKQKQLSALSDQISKAMDAQNWDDAFKFSDELIPFDQDTAAAARYLVMLKKGDFDGAYAYCKQLADGPFSRDARGLYSLGWLTVNPLQPWKKTDYDLAVEVLKKATDLTYNKNPEMLDALAWAYFQKGDKASAVSTEQNALNVARDDQKFKLNQNLRTFQKQ